MPSERRDSFFPKVTPAMIEAGAEVLYSNRLFPESPWINPDDVVVELYRAMYALAPQKDAPSGKEGG